MVNFILKLVIDWLIERAMDITLDKLHNIPLQHISRKAKNIYVTCFLVLLRITAYIALQHPGYHISQLRIS